MPEEFGMNVWVWVAQGPVMQSTDNPANWLVNGMTPLTPPPNDGSVRCRSIPTPRRCSSHPA